MDSVFCCSSIQPYRPQILSHEAKFRAFLNQATASASIATESSADTTLLDDGTSYVIQVVCQINYGAIEWKKYFAHRTSLASPATFQEVTEKDLIQANFQKLNSYKNFKCVRHNKFFELNIYEKDPVNKHHWRANIARPAEDIDLPTQASTSSEAPGTIPTLKASPEATSSIIADNGNCQSSNVVESSPASALGRVPFQASTASSAIISLFASADEAEGREMRFVGVYDDDDDEDEDDIWYNSPFGGVDTQSEKDFTACSADDCGYCGHCDY
ncbi:hypothetical protein EG329_002206 [Mollisiaceae sp. DMI_Dod_QoI]|nr:hypothetical protein EG329_002206 [Helotiales sp. DMI_Dod_QoI]